MIYIYKNSNPFYYYDICIAQLGDTIVLEKESVYNITNHNTLTKCPAEIVELIISKSEQCTLENECDLDNKHSFQQITDNMFKTYLAKNHDYGNSFDESLDKHGLIASVVRMSDKMNRLESLVNKDAAVKESIQDTLLDLANYAIMTVMWMNNK